jgi:hypothetical protein
MPLKNGASVRQVMPAPIAGKVVDAVYDAVSGTFNYLVRWTSAEGHEQSRWFNETEIEEVQQ